MPTRTRDADARRADLLRAADNPYATEGEPVHKARTDDAVSDPSLRKARSEALGAVEYYAKRDQLDSTAADRLDGLIRRDGPRALASRYLTAVGDPAYLSAFGKLLADPTTGHLRFSTKEVEAVRLVSAVDAERSLNRQGKTQREAMRALKRHLSRRLYKRLIAVPLTS